MPFRPFLKSHWLQFHCKNRHYACAVLVFSRTLATKTTRLRAQKLASEASVPTQAKERAKTEEETVSSMSHRLVLVGVDWSLQISQNQKSRKSRDLAKIDHLGRDTSDDDQTPLLSHEYTGFCVCWLDIANDLG